MYKYDMSKEKEKRPLFPEGWRKFEILDCKEETSKAGNTMFRFTIIDIESEEQDDIYAIAVAGKRWFLKQILTACGVEAGKDGVYEWEIKDVLTETIYGRVVHYDEEWINRENRTIKTKRYRIAEVRDEIPEGEAA